MQNSKVIQRNQRFPLTDKNNINQIKEQQSISQNSSNNSKLIQQEQNSSFHLTENQQPNTKNTQNINTFLNKLGLIEQKPSNQMNKVMTDVLDQLIEKADPKNIIAQYDQSYKQIYKELEVETIKNRAKYIYINQFKDMQYLQSLDQSVFIMKIYKSLRLIFKKISIICFNIVQNSIFEAFILIIILLNSVKMALDDPLSNYVSPTIALIQQLFLIVYSIEMGIKIMAYGFLFNKKAYLRDPWNILDFTIVMTSILPYIINLNFSVNSLRAIRVLRPLKSITKIKSLKMIVRTLFLSFSLVMDSLYILIFVILILAISGTLLFGGGLKSVCMQLSTGILTTTYCQKTASSCGQGFICVKGIANPNFSIYNFDTILWSMLSVFQTITLEGWSSIMIYLELTQSFVCFIYSVSIIFICEYVLLNITLAILKYKFEQVKNDKIQQQQQQCQDYSTQLIKKLGIYKKISNLHESNYSRYEDNQKIFMGSLNLYLKSKQKATKVQDRIDNRRSIKKTYFKNPLPEKNRRSIREKKQQVVKFNLKDLIGNQKIENKWDPKTLNFEPIQFSQIKLDEKKIRSRRNIQKQLQKLQQQNKQLEESSQQQNQYQSQNEKNENENSLDQSQHGIEFQIDLKKKEISTEKLINNYLKKAFQQQEDNTLMDFNKLLNQIQNNNQYRLIDQQQKSSKNLQFPDLQFDHQRKQKFYKTFQNLGKFSIKRQKESIQLNQIKNLKLNNRLNKMKKKSIKKMTIAKITEENQMDIKQLELLNELEKKSLKCRLFNNKFEQTKQYSYINQILTSKICRQEQKVIQKMKQEQEKIKKLNIFYKLDKGGNQIQDKKYEIQENLKIPDIKFTPPSSINSNNKVKNAILKNTLKMEESIQNQYKNKLKNINRENNFHHYQQATEVQLVKQYFLTIQKKKQELDTTIKIDPKVIINQKKEQPQTQYLHCQQQFYKASHQDLLDNLNHIQVISSALDVFKLDQIKEKIIDSLNINPEQYQIYIKGIFGILTVIRNKIYILVESSIYDNIMMLIVILNTILLCLNGFVSSQNSNLVILNEVLTFIYTFDAILKIITYNIYYFQDIMNILDLFVVIVSLIQIFLSANLSSLKSIRILRVFRILRVTRLIRSLRYMKIVINVVSNILQDFFSIFGLLVLFIFIYTLLGMQIFGGTFIPQSVSGIRQNFDSFFNALFSVFQVLTVQNWNDIQTAVLLSSNSEFTVLYLISWIFLGNWILLNLLQAVLLDGFDSDQNEDTKQILEQQKKQSHQQGYESTLMASSVVNTMYNHSTVQKYTSLRMQTQTEDDNTKQNKEQQQDYSLLFIPKSNVIRKYLIILTSHQYFQRLIIFIILINSMKLVFDTYIVTGSQMQTISKQIDTIFNIIFILQSTLKIIAQGFIFGPKSYLSDNWSKMDLFIVISGIIDMVVTTIDLSIVKMLRTLRPIRIVSRNVNMKIMITALAESMSGIFNILIIILLVFMMFGILGMNLFQGKLYYCNSSSQLKYGNYGPYGINQSQCESSGGVWTLQFINFENILNSLLSLYVFSTRQNWPYYIFSLMDADSNGPTLNQNQLLSFMFALVFIFVGSLFFMDLLVGVLFMNYSKAESKLRPKILLDKQINWINLQKLLVRTDPCLVLYLKPQNKFQLFFFKIVNFSYFDKFIVFCIISNIVIMMVTQDDQQPQTTLILKNLNLSFSCVFIIEMTLKLLAYGKGYFLSGWNLFDFCIVIFSILDILLEFSGISIVAISFLPKIARIFRVLRITRLLRTFKSFKGLQKLIQTFLFMLPALGNGLALVSLYLFISSILASFLLQNIQSDFSGFYNTTHNNFNYFHTSLQLLFITNTGENWYVYMFESIYPGFVTCIDGANDSCVHMYNLIFWLPFIFFSQKVFFELFVLIVLDQFESNYINQNNPLGIFANLQDDFRKNWIEKTEKFKGTKIESKKIVDFVLQLNPPLGMGSNELQSKYEQQLKKNQTLTQEQIKNKSYQFYMKLKHNSAKWVLKIDELNNKTYINYHELIYYLSKNAFTNEFISQTNEKQNQILEKQHLKWDQQIKSLYPSEKQNQKDKISVQTPNMNPMQTLLFSKIIIRAWQNYSKNKEKIRQNKQNLNNQQEVESYLQSIGDQIEQIDFQVCKPQQKRRQGLFVKEVYGNNTYLPNTESYADEAYIDNSKQKKPKRRSSQNKSFSRESFFT